MYPAVPTIGKRTSAPTVFSGVTAADPQSDAVKDMTIPTGTVVYIHTPGLHYNGIPSHLHGMRTLNVLR